MNIVGRSNEIKELEKLYNSKKPELVAIYGRRRVGKTYLVNEIFNNNFSFKHSGLSPLELKDTINGKSPLNMQLEHFYHSLKLYGMKENKVPKDWLEAFFMLKVLLKEKDNGERQVVFIDELPWLDTRKSGFITGFESFWNGFADSRNNVVIICGSAISWMTRELINNHGGLYGRVTYEMKLKPFNLRECSELFENNNVKFSKYDICQAYMCLGGIPYYLNYIKRELSLPQNIDQLFSQNGVLRDEFNRLFFSSFGNPEYVMRIVKTLSTKSIGLTRDEIINIGKLADGGNLSKALNALINSDFIIKYSPFGKTKLIPYYKLIDPFCIFYLKFIEGSNSFSKDYFQLNNNSQQLVTWRGYSFENVIFNHIPQIKEALGIRGVSTNESTYFEKSDNEVSQIDLIISRNDNIVNLCEVKFYSDDYVQDKNSHLSLIRKQESLSKYINKKQIIRNVLITTYGIKDNEYKWDYDAVITLDDLFK